MKKILIVAAILLVAYLVYKFVIKKNDETETGNEPSEEDKALAKQTRDNMKAGIAVQGSDITQTGFTRKLRGQ